MAEVEQTAPTLPVRFVKYVARHWIVAGLILGAGAMLLASDIYPIITNDSLAYIGHSNSIVSTGFVQLGYRQVGYPAFLAMVDLVASVVRLEPLLMTVVLQRLIYLSALWCAAWWWRWRALPLVAFGLLPTLLAYTNLILTEGLGVGLVLWYGILVARLIQLNSRSDANKQSMRALTISVTCLYLALAMIRFQYAMIVVGVLAAWLVMYRSGRKGRIVTTWVALAAMVVGATFFVFVSRENADEYGDFFPSVRGERSQFWAAWQVVFTLSPENRKVPELSELYGNGSPYVMMGVIDSLPTYDQQRDAYDEAMKLLIADSHTSLTRERAASFLGVLRGGRIDDIRGIVDAAARSSLATFDEIAFRAKPIRQNGIDYFADHYNNGRTVQPVLISALAPLRTFPNFIAILAWLLPGATIVLAAGLIRRESRLLAATGLLTLLGTASIFGFLLMDNVRFILIPNLFVLASATAVADTLWRSRASRASTGTAT